MLVSQLADNPRAEAVKSLPADLVERIDRIVSLIADWSGPLLEGICPIGDILCQRRANREGLIARKLFSALDFPTLCAAIDAEISERVPESQRAELSARARSILSHGCNS